MFECRKMWYFMPGTLGWAWLSNSRSRTHVKTPVWAASWLDQGQARWRPCTFQHMIWRPGPPESALGKRNLYIQPNFVAVNLNMILSYTVALMPGLVVSVLMPQRLVGGSASNYTWHDYMSLSTHSQLLELYLALYTTNRERTSKVRLGISIRVSDIAITAAGATSSGVRWGGRQPASHRFQNTS